MNEFTRRKFFKGEVIIKEGDIPDIVYLLEEGEVRITKKMSDGLEVELYTLGPGQIFGEMGLLEVRPRSATVTAITDIEVKLIDRDQLMILMRQSPLLLQEILVFLIARLRHSSTILTLLRTEAESRYQKCHK